MIFPLWIVLRRPLTTPESIKEMRPSENISVWTPRSFFFLSVASTASGMAPMPIWIVEPSSIRPEQ